ncbi:MAG: aminotransferase class III-fold pyridoxal phosphate-dependent enzyme, partial [Candidatus Omnitrophota bacterium]
GWQDYPAIIAPYNDLVRTNKLIEENKKDIAAIIVEPVSANSGVILPEDGFLRGLRDIADRYGFILIFDEVITGFRLGFGGAQGLFKVRPDLTTLGKIIGAGFPMGAFGGPREIMQLLAPEGEVYQAGTLSGSPVAVTAGLATLKILKNDNPYEALGKNTGWLCRQIEKAAKEFDIAIRINRAGSIFSIFFSGQEVNDYQSTQRQDTAFFRKFFHGLLKRGTYFSPSPFEANFLSAAHNAQDFKKTLAAVRETFMEIKRKERR